jgi:DNA-binding transcriptional MerR regulator
MTAPARQPRAGSSIGAVLAQLRPDFPDITISKIRFLESEGLLAPARTDAGYRVFTPADVERLRFVLAAQRDHYLPLKVIKAQLDAADRGLRPVAALDDDVGDRIDDGHSGTGDWSCPDAVRLSRAELRARAGIDGSLLAELEQFGLVRPDGAGSYDEDAVGIARTAAAFTGFGVEPRHLRAFRAAADREIGLLEQVLAPMRHHRDAAARDRSVRAGAELMALSVTLHRLLVEAGLRTAFGS